MHVAVAGVHVGSDEQAAGAQPGMDGLELLQQPRPLVSAENLRQRPRHLLAVGDTQVPAQQQVQHPVTGPRLRQHLRVQQLRVLCRRLIKVIEQAGPARLPGIEQFPGGILLGLHNGAVLLAVGKFTVAVQRRQVAGEEFPHRLDDSELVARRILDVHALDAGAVFIQPLQRNDHVLVDLEGIGMRGNRRGARAVGPELPARLGADGDEAFRTALIGHAHHGRAGVGHRRLVVAGDVDQQHHLGQFAARRLAAVLDGPDITFVHVFHAGQQHIGAGIQVVPGFHDSRDREAQVGAEELETDSARVLRLAMQDEFRRRDETVAAFLLDARDAREKLVRHVLAEARFAQRASRHADDFRLLQRLVGTLLVADYPEFDLLLQMDLAQVVVQPLDLQPVAVRGHHAPGDQIVERRAPEHGLLAAGVHGDVAADGRGILGSRVHREYVAVAPGVLAHPAGDHAGAGAHGRHRPAYAGQFLQVDISQGFELFRVDHGGIPVQRHGAAVVAGAAAAWNDRQPERDAGPHDVARLLFGVRTDHHAGHLHAPVGGVGGMGDARHAAEVDIVAARDTPQALTDPPAQLPGAWIPVGETPDGLAGGGCELQGIGIALGPGHDLVEAMVHRPDERIQAFFARQQVVLDIGITVHHPQITEHLEQHARRPPGHPGGAQSVEQVPRRLPEVADNDFTVGKRGVVVGYFADTF